MAANVLSLFAQTASVVALVASASRANAPCSEATDARDAGIVILRCADVIFVAETNAVRSSALSMTSHPRAIQLDAGAIAVSTNPSAPPFSILTPDAVVSASDGDWAVAAEPGGAIATVWRGSATMWLRSDASVRTLDAETGAFEPGRLARLREALERARAP